jgi:hypothetical protein
MEVRAHPCENRKDGAPGMTIHTSVVEPHWNYLLAIERDVIELSRYVEFDSRNFGCFSIEIARVLLSCGAETDVISKGICAAINPKSKADKIHAYRTEIKEKYPEISDFHVLLPKYGLTLTPWDEWKRDEGVPAWWTAYNKVKHHRHAEYEKASLKNALNSLAGLFVMAIHLVHANGHAGDFLACPFLLNVEAKHVGGREFGGAESRIRFRL